MQTQPKVRFYITQSDDQPVVRTIPVPSRVAEPAPIVEQPAVMPAIAATPAPSRTRNVAGRVRSVVKRGSQPK